MPCKATAACQGLEQPATIDDLRSTLDEPCSASLTSEAPPSLGSESSAASDVEAPAQIIPFAALPSTACLPLDGSPSSLPSAPLASPFLPCPALKKEPEREAEFIGLWVLFFMLVFMLPLLA